MESTASEPAGRRIGKYEVLGELGHGGMAVVYRARDTQLLRDVAVKVLHPHLANDPESRQRFVREAQAAARLRHPNIVEVFDFSVETDRESFMVSELLEGPTLRRFAELHPGMPAEVAAAIGMVLCDALACAHAQGVIHRDVKPDNILLQTGGILKLTDFGIAHVADGNGMTVTGQVLGSPAHMAPEQIDGRHIDARVDIFAAGTVLYALAVGRLPFEASHPHALLRKILETEYADPIRVAPTVGHKLAAIIRKCLQREPEERYASANDLKAALVAFVAEAGWDDAQIPLRKYFEDPEAFAKAHRALLIERLPEAGVRARKNGQLQDALGYFNRALALEPTDERVLGLVRGISRRRRVSRVVAGAAIVGVAAAASALVVVEAGRFVRVRPPVVRAEPRTRIEPAVAPSVPAPVATAPVAVPAAAAPVDAAVQATAPEVAVTHAATTQQRHAAGMIAVHTVVHATQQGGTSVAATMRNVVLTVHGLQGCSYSFDSHTAQGYGDHAPVALTVGGHSLRIESNDGTCAPMQTHVDVEAGEGPQEIVRTYRCNTSGAADPNQHADSRAEP